MMKRFFALLTACIWFLLPLSVYADVIWGPHGDHFFDEHEIDCKQMVRYFYANGKNGFVSIKESPISDKEVAQFKNGEKIYIGFTYDYQGVLWGVAATDKEEIWNGSSGWIPMDQLVVVYDYISFDEEHEKEYYEYKIVYETLRNAKGAIVLWTWPGSGNIESTMDKSEFDLYKYDSSLTHAYKDKQGREWLYISYWNCHKHVWICLDDPTNTQIPAFNPAPQPQLIQPVESPAPTNISDSKESAQGNTNDSKNDLGLPASLVAGVVFITTILLKFH